MTRYVLPLAIISTLLLSSCKKGDTGTGPTPPKDAIVGTWVSEGNNVAMGLRVVLKTKKITATFNENNTYTVVSVDSNNVSVTYTGTYQSAEKNDTLIHAITLNQTTPAALTSQGIYQVKGTTMTYEVIQTNPPIQGFTPPTVEEGFGSTKYNNVKLGTYWVQIYVKP